MLSPIFVPVMRVAVLSMEAATSEKDEQVAIVKVQAEARTGAEMANYVAFLAERKPFGRAYLVQHEIDETSQERPYRFTVEALWSS